VADDVAKRSGWITFAEAMALLAGGYNALSGIAAVFDDDTIASQAKEVLYRSAFAVSLSNSSCVIAPASSNSLALAISVADPPAASRTYWSNSCF
jgi:hypothetical protein